MHALATPLVTKADGTKFGKTEGGTVWLDAEMTSPYAFYQFWLNAEDATSARYLRVFTFRSREEIEALEESAAASDPRRARRSGRWPTSVTTLVHGAEQAAARSRRPRRALFGRGDAATALDAATLRRRHGRAAAAPPAQAAATGSSTCWSATGLVAEPQRRARRAVAEGGAYVNNVKVDRRRERGRSPAGRDCCCPAGWPLIAPSGRRVARGGHASAAS